MGTSVLNGFDGIAYQDILTSPAELPLSVSVTQRQEDVNPRAAEANMTSGGLRDIPDGVARLLLDTYICRILPQYPYFLEDDLRRQFELIYTESHAGIPQDAYFVVCMILAISVLTSKAQRLYDVLSLAERLHQDALRHSGFLKDANIRTLQCLMLLEQFAALLPATGNLWHLVGEGMKLAIELGLHQEPANSLRHDCVSVDLRRRVFWAIYAMERSLAVTSHRPFTLKDEYINTKFPSVYEDSKIHPDRIETGGPRVKFQFLNFIRFRQIQSEICSVQYFNRQLENSSYTDWMTDMERKIQNLQEDILSMVETAPDWFSHSVWQNRLMLHRPCSRNPNPAKESMKACFEAAIGVAQGCWLTMQSGYLTFVFHLVHNAFEAGATMLYLLKEDPVTFRALYGNSEIIKHLTQLSGVFTLLSERWPVAVYTGDLFDDLKKSVLKILLRSSVSELTAHDKEALGKLDDIVLRKAVEDLYVAERRERCLTPEHNSQLVPSFRPNQDVLFPVEDYWEDVYNFDFGKAFPDPQEMLLGSAETGGGDVQTPQDEPQSDETLVWTSTLSSKLQVAINLLPACNSCRQRRVKCDRQLPACRHCSKSQTTCLYYDYVLSEDIPRRYVDALRSKLQELIAMQEQQRLLVNSFALVSASTNMAGRPFPPSISFQANDTTSQEVLSHLVVKCTDEELVSISTAYYGPTSAFVQLLKLDIPIEGWTTMHMSAPQEQRLLDAVTLWDDFDSPKPQLPPPHVAFPLISIFYQSINIFYPVFTSGSLENLYTAITNSPQVDSESGNLYTLYLVFAISMHLLCKADRRMAGKSTGYFRQAVREWQSSSKMKRTSTVRVGILLCIYILMNPSAGDVWRMVGFVCRICLDLTNLKIDNQMHEERYESALLYRTSYCLECDIAIAFGRPTQLPDRSDDITFAVPETALEKVSTYIHKIARLKAAILDNLLKEAGVSEVRQQFPEWREEILGQLEVWVKSWKEEISLAEIGSPNSRYWSDETFSSLRAWGQFLYQDTLLLAAKAYDHSHCVPIGDALTYASQFIDSCHELHNRQAPLVHRFLLNAQSTTLPTSSFSIFPITWPIQHRLLSAGLTLASAMGAAPNSTMSPQYEQSVQRCTKLLTTLEADQDTLSHGFCSILERIFERAKPLRV